MKRFLLTSLMALSAIAGVQAQRSTPPEDFTVIDEQPEGELRIYTRSGMKISENEDGTEITTDRQSGTVNIVWGTDGTSVYIQRPVSDSYYDGWVRGTLSDDGTLLTVPLGQYTAYTFSFDMAVQVQLMAYDEATGSYAVDSTATAVTYAIAPDGTLTLLGTDQSRVLGVVNRAFGNTFSYLDGEWLGYGDFDTVYTLFDGELQMPPATLRTTDYIATTGSYDGYGWVAYTATARLGFQGDDAWLQGLSNLLPNGWLKGRRQGQTITFPAGQLLGSYFNVPRYMVCAEPDAQGNPVIRDLVLTLNDDGTLTTYQDILLSAAKTDVQDFAAYYMGMTLATQADQTVGWPEGLTTEAYAANYQDVNENGLMVAYDHTLRAGALGSDFYLQGVAPWLPDALVRGAVAPTADGTAAVTFASPQYLGIYTVEGEGSLPFYFQAFDAHTGQLLPAVTFAYDAATRTLSRPSAAIGIGIDKTGWLMSLSLYNATFAPAGALSVPAIAAPSLAASPFDLQGRPLQGAPRKGLYIQNGRKVVVK